jgi:hypothetical protein
VSGSSTFGPIKVLDVGVGGGKSDQHVLYLWANGLWIRAKVPEQASDDDLAKIWSWAQNPKFTNDLDSEPGRVQISMWDRQIHWLTMKNLTPPTTIGEQAHANLRAFVELAFGMVFLGLSFLVWREGHRRGIRLRSLDSPYLLSEPRRRS